MVVQLLLAPATILAFVGAVVGGLVLNVITGHIFLMDSKNTAHIVSMNEKHPTLSAQGRLNGIRSYMLGAIEEMRGSGMSETRGGSGMLHLRLCEGKSEWFYEGEDGGWNGYFYIGIGIYEDEDAGGAGADDVESNASPEADEKETLL
jgi:hypothetical protein